MRNPRREVEVAGPRTVRQVLAELDVPVESVLVIRGDDLLLRNDLLEDGDEVELRPVISGGFR